MHKRQMLLQDGPTQIAQWLMFDPMSEEEAQDVLQELRSRLPVLSFRFKSFFAVPSSPLTTGGLIYNGPIPTIIPADLTPSDPAWLDAAASSSIDGETLLSALPSCPVLNDERILAAIQLSLTSGFDILPRSVFLSQLTIIDSLAVRRKRALQIQEWLDLKIAEAEIFSDAGLLSALANLKENSHGSAIRELVGRASKAMHEDGPQTNFRKKRVSELYNVRSQLSHANSDGILTGQHVTDAHDIADLIIKAAIENPAILDDADLPT